MSITKSYSENVTSQSTEADMILKDIIHILIPLKMLCLVPTHTWDVIYFSISISLSFSLLLSLTSLPLLASVYLATSLLYSINLNFQSLQLRQFVRPLYALL